MVRALALFLLVMMSFSVVGETKDRRQVAYSNLGGATTTLDVYAPEDGSNHPIVIWIHGGGWRRGDKRNVDHKPTAFTEHGYVFVSMNYRLHPATDFRGQGADIAKAIRWAKDHAGEFGGDGERVFLMGHSAGAHLAALVATDESYLKNEGLNLSNLRGAILLDGAGYDIPRQIQIAGLPRLKEMYLEVFGKDESAQRAASPVSHVAEGKGIPPFLILHIASRRDGRLQSESLGARLRESKIPAQVVSTPNKTHASINQELGSKDDGPTEEVFKFLQERSASTEKDQRS
jgi:acetyl esterase/lipase